MPLALSRSPARPTLALEKEMWDAGHERVAGLDEAGRGPLAGPVAAAAVLLPPDLVQARLVGQGDKGSESSWLADVHDSKLLSPRRREALAGHILECASVGLGMVSSDTIDDMGIVKATKMAMLRALTALGGGVDALLVDALPFPEGELPSRSIVHGDRLSLSIACASIVAKVARDKIMYLLDVEYPGYLLARNKGYATPGHLRALRQLGPSPVHRRSFRPVHEITAASKDSP